MAVNAINTRVQATPNVNSGRVEKFTGFFEYVAEWVRDLFASPAPLELYEKEVRDHLSVRERTEVDAHFLGL